MKILITLVILLSSIWMPAYINAHYEIKGWIVEPIWITYTTVYLLAFLTLLFSLRDTTKD